MVECNCKFKVGDKVRILDVDSIFCGRGHWNNGDVVKCVGHYGNNRTPRFESMKLAHEELIIIPREFHAIELVESAPKAPTKKQRITKLEDLVDKQAVEIEELKKRLDKLEFNKVSHATKETSQEIGEELKTLSKRIESEHLTSNQQRAKIIEEAKKFVTETIESAGDSLGHIVIEDKRGFSICRYCEIRFEVNAEKRTVVALVISVGDGTVLGRSIVKCHVDDVFNEHIGKAITVGRLFNKDVSKFENAVQPDEFVVEMEVVWFDDYNKPYHRTVERVEKGTVRFTNDNFMPKDELTILDDTNAQY